MKRTTLNKQLIKAVTIGISAGMMLQPVTAFAAEGDTVPAKTSEEETGVDAAKSEQNALETIVNGDASTNKEGLADIAQEINTDVAEIQKDFMTPANPENPEKAEVITNEDLVKEYDDNFGAIAEDAKELGEDVNAVQEDVTNIGKDLEAVASKEEARNDAVTAVENTPSATVAANEAGNAFDGVTDQIDTASQAIDDATTEKEAQDAYDIADKAITDATTKYETAKSTYESTKEAYEKALEAANTAQKEYLEAVGTASADASKAEEDLLAAQAKAADLKKKLAEASGRLDAAKQSTEQAITDEQNLVAIYTERTEIAAVKKLAEVDHNKKIARQLYEDYLRNLNTDSEVTVVLTGKEDKSDADNRYFEVEVTITEPSGEVHTEIKYIDFYSKYHGKNSPSRSDLKVYEKVSAYDYGNKNVVMTYLEYVDGYNKKKTDAENAVKTAKKDAKDYANVLEDYNTLLAAVTKADSKAEAATKKVDVLKKKIADLTATYENTNLSKDEVTNKLNQLEADYTKAKANLASAVDEKRVVEEKLSETKEKLGLKVTEIRNKNAANQTQNSGSQETQNYEGSQSGSETTVVATVAKKDKTAKTAKTAKTEKDTPEVLGATKKSVSKKATKTVAKSTDKTVAKTTEETTKETEKTAEVTTDTTFEVKETEQENTQTEATQEVATTSEQTESTEVNDKAEIADDQTALTDSVNNNQKKSNPLVVIGSGAAVGIAAEEIIRRGLLFKIFKRK